MVYLLRTVTLIGHLPLPLHSFNHQLHQSLNWMENVSWCHTANQLETNLSNSLKHLEKKKRLYLHQSSTVHWYMQYLKCKICQNNHFSFEAIQGFSSVKQWTHCNINTIHRYSLTVKEEDLFIKISRFKPRCPWVSLGSGNRKSLVFSSYVARIFPTKKKIHTSIGKYQH